MDTTDKRINELEQQLAALTERVTVLEGRRSGRRVSEEPAPYNVSPPYQANLPSGAQDSALLQQLGERSGTEYEEDDRRGAVAYAGAVQLGASHYVWHVERGLPGLLGMEVAPLARVLAALGSPPRLVLVRALLRGPCTSQQLQEALGVSSAGPLYHHLKELIAAEVVIQRSRSQYAIAAQNIVPILAILAAALDVTMAADEAGAAG